jgi:hypothetical protein
MCRKLNMEPEVSTQKVTSCSNTSPKMVGRLLETGMVVGCGGGGGGGTNSGSGLNTGFGGKGDVIDVGGYVTGLEG